MSHYIPITEDAARQPCDRGADGATHHQRENMKLPVSVAAHKPTASGSLPPGFSQLAEELPRLVSGVEGHLGDRDMRLLTLVAALPTAQAEVLKIGSFKSKSSRQGLPRFCSKDCAIAFKRIMPDTAH
ncbi:MAG: hypothetical protein EXS00_02090 [Phycisphaerales bacterium]|nr:hypothetical protein [Phycisphaerales bacterium]